MFNKVVLLGNLTRDIELRYFQSGSAIGSTGLAVSRKFSLQNGEKREETCFIDITFFGRQAEIANQYLGKGSKILVEGRLKFEQWQDQNGINRSKHSIVVENMEMLSSGGFNQGNQNGNFDGYNNANGANYQQKADRFSARQQPNYSQRPPQKAVTNESINESYEDKIPDINVDEDLVESNIKENEEIPF